MAKKPRADISQPDMPDEVRRRDQPEIASPSSIPRPDEDVTATGQVDTADGGSPDHPIHDEALDDLESEDYEELVDDARMNGFEPLETEADEDDEDDEDEEEEEDEPALADRR